jgi:hypothetical protein
MSFFDFERAAQEAGISDGNLETIKQTMRGEFPEDDMLWELHVLRACNAVRDGQATIEDVLCVKAA